MTARAVTLVAALTVLVSVSYRVAYLNASLRSPFNAYGYSELWIVFFLGRFREEHWPYFLFPYPYPPVSGWISAALSYLTTDLMGLLILWGVIVAAAAGMTAYLLAREAPLGRVLAFWSLSPQLLVFGGLNFDALPTLALVAATSAVRARRLLAASVLLALGAATKVFPLIALPLLTLRVAVRASVGRAALVVATAALALAVVEGPAVLAPYSVLVHARQPYHPATWNPDTIWIAFAAVAGLVTDPVTINEFVTVVSASGLGLTYAWLCVWPAFGRDELRLLFWRGVVVLLLWTPQYSPQYSLWALPALVLFAPRPGLFALLAAGDILVFLTIFPLGAGAFGTLGSARSIPAVGVLLSGVLLRHAALLLLLRALVRARGPDGREEGAL